MSAKPISVRVSKEKLLASLTNALEDRNKKVAAHNKAKSDHEKAVKDWEKKVIEAISAGKMKPKTVSHTRQWRTDDAIVGAEFAIPSSLAYPKEPESDYREWEVRNDIEELENAIAILKMTDEEMVSTSTYKGVARFIK